MIRVAIADDQALVRSAFALLLRSDPRIELVGEAADGVEAVELARREQPDVMLMDVRMPRLDGVEATRRIVGQPGNRTDDVLHLVVGHPVALTAGEATGRRGGGGLFGFRR